MKYVKNPTKAIKESKGTAKDSCVRANNTTLIQNAGKNGNNTQLARICTGGGCSFCQANEGIIKGDISKKAQLHARCACQIVMVLKQIERQKLAESLEVPDKDDIPAIKNELAKARDWGLITYDKPLETFPKDDERDLIAHLLLAKNGWSFKVLKEDAPEGFSNLDLKIGGDLWEIKSPVGDKPKVVQRNIEKAVHQFRNAWKANNEDVNIIINNQYTGLEDNLAIQVAERRKKITGAKRIVLIKKDWKLVEIE